VLGDLWAIFQTMTATYRRQNLSTLDAWYFKEQAETGAL